MILIASFIFCMGGLLVGSGIGYYVGVNTTNNNNDKVIELEEKLNLFITSGP